jgi:hypothetical protein
MPMGIFARLIDLESMMCLLDQRHLQAVCYEQRNQFLDQACFACTAIPGETENFHEITLARLDAPIHTPSGLVRRRYCKHCVAA